MSRVGKVPPPSGPPAPLRLDAAARELLAQPVDAATRLELERFQDALTALGVQPEGLDPPNLTGAVFAFIMPRLSDPGLLRLERRRALIHRLLADGDAVRAGTLALRHELRNIDALRHNRDSLVEG